MNEEDTELNYPVSWLLTGGMVVAYYLLHRSRLFAK